MNKSFLLAALAAAALALPAQAGGLFGKGGLIRGDVGAFMDRHVEKPILTPAARGTTIAAGAAVGTMVGGMAGMPNVGGLLGAGVGHAINETAAGRPLH